MSNRPTRSPNNNNTAQRHSKEVDRETCNYSESAVSESFFLEIEDWIYTPSDIP